MAEATGRGFHGNIEELGRVLPDSLRGTCSKTDTPIAPLRLSRTSEARLASRARLPADFLDDFSNKGHALAENNRLTEC
jgi:hypothetical protein